MLAPEGPEELIEHGQVLVAVHQQRAKAVVEVVPVANLDVVESLRHVDHAPRVHVEAGCPQQALEPYKIPKEDAHREARVWLARSSSSCTRTPRSAWWSSWFLTRTPSVSSRTSASSSFLSNATSAATQS